MIERVAVDFMKTFGRPGIFMGVEPKMERLDKNDPTSEQVQSRDKNGGGLKWVATVALKYQANGRDKKEMLSITLLSPSEPCTNLHVGQAVIVEGLEMGLMPQEKGFSQFWSAVSIRPMQPAQPAQPARAASGQ